jgi:hypothetical protein
MREKDTAYKQIVNIHDYMFNCNTAPCDKSPGKDAGFNNLYISPYMTGLDPNAGLPGVTSYMWVDELIISTQPIAPPTLKDGPDLVAFGHSDRASQSQPELTPSPERRCYTNRQGPELLLE